MFKLVIQDDEGKTTVVPLIRDEITIGRKEGNTIRLTERNVSRRHAKISRQNSEVTIEDLGSYNGIRVNNARIPDKVALRISDQVQIGDYKLYLKAEAEQAEDDGKTIPVERIDGAATEVMPAMRNTEPPTPGLSAVTAPMGAAKGDGAPSAVGDNDPTQKMPAATPDGSGAKVVGHANRTMVAMEGGAAAVMANVQAAMAAKTAQQAAQPAPAAQKHARLVVLSSNFAGTEFTLNRPQMIIGRTPDNDVVIDHRSISRNHAKVAREADTGRYTISDLQSANGVRVNGQEYPKVELRRGDIIDLGHVRLRFVDAGEDFVFDRDAVVSEAPTEGGGRGTWIALALAAVVLGAVLIFFMRGKSKDDKKVAVIDAGAGQMVAVTDAAGAAPGPSDAATGSMAVTADGGTTVEPIQDNNQLETKANECAALAAAEKWQDLHDCGAAMAALTGGGQPGKVFEEQASKEQANALALDDIRAAKADGMKAAAALKKVKTPSVYEDRINQAYADAMAAYADNVKGRAVELARQNKCSDLKKLANDAGKIDANAGAAAKAVACSEGSTQVSNPNPNPNTNTIKPPPAECDAAALMTEARSAASGNNFGVALKKAEEAMRCSGGNTPGNAAFAAMAACRSHNVSAAKKYVARAPGALSTCKNNMTADEYAAVSH